MILSNLDDEFNFCKINKYAKELCSTEFFWIERIKKEFGQNFKIDKPKNFRWMAYYKKLQYLSFSWLEKI